MCGSGNIRPYSSGLSKEELARLDASIAERLTWPVAAVIMGGIAVAADYLGSGGDQPDPDEQL